MNTKDQRIKAIIEQVIETYLPAYELTLKEFSPVVVDKPKSKLVWIIDAGHGGINPSNGKYQTKGKGFKFPDGFTIKEGVLNRDVVNIFLELAKGLPFELRYELTAHEWRDTSLRERTNKVNRICDREKANNCKLLSIHDDGISSIPKANGVGVFHQNKYSFRRSNYKKLEKGGRDLAKIVSKNQSIEMSDCRNRGVKPHNLHILRESDCDSTLVEGAFMTNRANAEYISSKVGKIAYAKVLIATVLEVENSK